MLSGIYPQLLNCLANFNSFYQIVHCILPNYMLQEQHDLQFVLYFFTQRMFCTRYSNTLLLGLPAIMDVIFSGQTYAQNPLSVASFLISMTFSVKLCEFFARKQHLDSAIKNRIMLSREFRCLIIVNLMPNPSEFNALIHLANNIPS